MPGPGTEPFGLAVSAWTEGRLEPACTLWASTFMSSVLPDCASAVPGLWHITQYSTSMRGPPCTSSLAWQASHSLLLEILRVVVTTVAPVDGR